MSCSRTNTSNRTKKIGSSSRIRGRNMSANRTVTNSTNLRSITSSRWSNLDQLRSKKTLKIARIHDASCRRRPVTVRHETAVVDKIPDLPGTAKTLEIDDVLSLQPPDGQTDFFFKKKKLSFLPGTHGLKKQNFLFCLHFPSLLSLALVNEVVGVVELKPTLVHKHQSLSSCCQWSGYTEPSDSRGTQLAGTSNP